jgi:5-methylcytosine-specific restriction endonuclease McrA
MRSVPEWSGSTDDAAIPARVRLRIWQRGKGRCELCTRKIMTAEGWEIDHRLALVLGGGHRESNLQVICKWCHRSKTRGEQAQKAKADRAGKRHAGIKKPRSIRSWRKFNGERVFAPRER